MINATVGDAVVHPVDGIGVLSSLDKEYASIQYGKELKKYAVSHPITSLIHKASKTEVAKTVKSYQLPADIDFTTYKVKAFEGKYAEDGPASIINKINVRTTEADIKHLMCVLAKHHGAVPTELDISQESKITVAGANTESSATGSILLWIHEPLKLVLRLGTDEGNDSQNRFEDILKTVLETNYPAASGWKIVKGHEKALKALTGCNDVKNVLSTAFYKEIAPFIG